MRDPAISVIIPARDAAGHLARQLQALATQDVPVAWEVLVADNGSTDGTREVAESWRTRLPLRVIEASDRRGANHARNRGAAEASGALLLFCDSDDIVQDGWVAAYHASRRSWDAAAGRLDTGLLNDERRRAWNAGMTLGDIPSLLGWLPTVNGCNFAVHRSVHAAVGGLDESFVSGCDDLEFGFRVQLAGFRLGYVPEAIVAYRFRRSLLGTARQHYGYGRNRPPLYRRYRCAGMRRQSGRHALGSWARLVAAAPGLRQAEGRGRLVADGAFLAGMAVGSIAARTAYLSE